MDAALVPSTKAHAAPPVSGAGTVSNSSNSSRFQQKQAARGKRPKKGGGRKASGTHMDASYLLNFKSEPRKAPARAARSVPRFSARRRDDSSYILSNFTLTLRQAAVVPDSATVTLARKLQWADVVQVTVQDTLDSALQCSICLEEPRVARMTSCGHIFCFCCLLRFRSVAASGNDGATPSYLKCPICQTLFAFRDLRACAVRLVPPLRDGERVELRLVHRRLHGTVVVPIECEATDDVPVLSSDEPMGPLYTRVAVVTDADDVVGRRERMEVLDALKHCENDESEFRFLMEALSLVGGDDDDDDDDDDDVGVPGPVGTPSGDGVSEATAAFYQASNGHPCFLSPFNWQILQAAYGKAEAMPRVFEAQILSVERAEQPESGTRHKFLRHLPPGARYSIVEVDLGGVVDAAVLARFRGKITKRAAVLRKERAREARERAERNARPIRAPPPAPAAFTLEDFAPLPRAEDFAPLPTSTGAPPVVVVEDEESSSEDLVATAPVIKRGGKEQLLLFASGGRTRRRY